MELNNRKRGSSRKWNKRVSRKFYDYLCVQIHITALLSSDIREDVIRECVDFYIDSGNEICKINVAEKVVFTLLKPQIDKAMLRSISARLAALRRSDMKRKAARESALHDNAAMASCDTAATGKDESNESPIDINQTMKSRDDKRALRRQAAISRRQLRHDKRLRRRNAKATT